MRAAYKYIRLTYGWQTKTYKWKYGWHTSIYEWYKNDVRVHTSNIQMTYEYIRRSYDVLICTRSTYKWHTNDRRANTKGIRITYEYIRRTYEWHVDKIRMSCDYMQMASARYEWHTNDSGFSASIRMPYKWHNYIFRRENLGILLLLSRLLIKECENRKYCSVLFDSSSIILMW